MIRSRLSRRTAASVAAVSVLLLVLAGCGGATPTDELSGPALLPGTVPAADDAAPDTATGETDAADPADGDMAPDDDTGTDGGFVLDLSGVDLPGDEPETALGGELLAPTDLAFVQRSIESANSGSYRFSMGIAMTIGDGAQRISIAPSAPLVVGEASGSGQRSLTDLSVIFESMWAEIPDADIGQLRDLFGGDLTIETIVSGTTMYIRAPLIGTIGGLGGPGLPAGLAELGDGWGSIDLTKVPGMGPAEIAALAGTQSGSGPDQVLAMLESLDADVADLGTTRLGDAEVNHYRTIVDLDAVVASGAIDTGTLGAPGAELDAILDGGPTVDIYIDADGHVRRLTMSFAADGLPGGGSLAMSTTIDFSDHGAAITIDTPADAVDLTDAFAMITGSA
jgi:hypothetical protein